MAKHGGAETGLWIAFGGAVALFLYTKRGEVVTFGTRALEAGKEAYFRAVLSAHAQPYADVILAVARESGVDPFVIYALGENESRWGDALSPKGPRGTGDYGHGHGIMQIDDRSWGAWLASNDWGDPATNVRKGVSILKTQLSFFAGNSSIRGYTDGTWVTIDKSASRLGVAPGQYRDPRPLAGDALTRAAIAAYNTGAGNVLMVIAAGGDPDTTTAHGNYGDRILATAADAAATFQSLVG